MGKENKKVYFGDFTAKCHLDNKDYFDEEGNLLLEEITGNAGLCGWNGNAKNLIKIGGIADFRNWKGSADKLIEIGSHASFDNWKGTANNLISIGGDAYFRFWEGSLNQLKTIGGAVYLKNWKGTAPLLSESYIFSELIGSRREICKFDKKTKLFFTGCFKGNEEELIEAVTKRHFVESRYYIEYMNFIEICNK